MQRDKALILNILRTIEGSKKIQWSGSETLNVVAGDAIASYAFVSHHVDLCVDAGYLVELSPKSYRLGMDGYDFVEQSRGLVSEWEWNGL